MRQLLPDPIDRDDRSDPNFCNHFPGYTRPSATQCQCARGGEGAFDRNGGASSSQYIERDSDRPCDPARDSGFANRRETDPGSHRNPKATHACDAGVVSTLNSDCFGLTTIAISDGSSRFTVFIFLPSIFLPYPVWRHDQRAFGRKMMGRNIEEDVTERRIQCRKVHGIRQAMERGRS